MYIEEDFESNFLQEISQWTLVFTNPDLEAQYASYKVHKRKVPPIFHKLLWSLVILFLIRHIQIITFIYIESPYITPNTFVVSEWVIIFVILTGICGEILAYRTNFFLRTRGFWMIMMWFIIIPYTSWVCYPRTLAMIPTGAPAYAFCVLTCTWYIHTWFVSVYSCSIGVIISSVFTQLGGLGASILLRCNLQNIVDKWVVNILIIWGFLGIVLTSYITEYSDRYGFLRNLKITEVNF